MKAGKVTARSGQKRDRARPAVRVKRKKQAGKQQAADNVVVSLPTPVAAAVVTLDADCTARHAGQLKTSLLGQIDTPAQVSIDIDGVERIDTVSLQLLAAFVRDRIQGGRQIAWAGHNEIFSRAVRLLGLATALRSPDLA